MNVWMPHDRRLNAALLLCGAVLTGACGSANYLVGPPRLGEA